MVNVKQLTKTYRDEAGSFDVLKETSFCIGRGEMVALAGVSGAGKTTLLQILGGLDKATGGTVEIDNQPLNSLSESKLAKFRRESIGFVFQFHHLMPDFTALENIFMPGLINKRKKKDLIDRARWLLNTIGLERRGSHYPAELSGGERQRVALARALFNEPKLVLADEPTGNLDTKNSEHLLELFKKTNRELNQTYLVATHNEDLARQLHRTVYIQDGKIISRS